MREKELHKIVWQCIFEKKKFVLRVDECPKLSLWQNWLEQFGMTIKTKDGKAIQGYITHPFISSLLSGLDEAEILALIEDQKQLKNFCLKRRN